jgi:hypothetical protein
MSGMQKLAVLALILSAVAAHAADAPRTEVLVVGVFHMANPGRDIFNTQVDDVLAPKRQAEIAEVVAALKKFAPTKVAVEADAGDERVTKRYAEYVAGKHELSRNETEQLGFRLAKELGHATVYPVDVDGEFPFRHLMNFAKASGRSKEVESMMSEVGAMVKAENEYLASHTILQMLLTLNSDDRVAHDVGSYYLQGTIGEVGDWAGADLVSAWFQRNMRIYSNVMNIATPQDRIVVIFGAGHLGWLQHDFASNPNVRVRKLAEFVK